jgi:hypothetical protein
MGSGCSQTVYVAIGSPCDQLNYDDVMCASSMWENYVHGPSVADMPQQQSTTGLSTLRQVRPEVATSSPPTQQEADTVMVFLLMWVKLNCLPIAVRHPSPGTGRTLAVVDVGTGSRTRLHDRSIVASPTGVANSNLSGNTVASLLRPIVGGRTGVADSNLSGSTIASLLRPVTGGGGRMLYPARPVPSPTVAAVINPVGVGNLSAVMHGGERVATYRQDVLAWARNPVGLGNLSAVMHVEEPMVTYRQRMATYRQEVLAWVRNYGMSSTFVTLDPSNFGPVEVELVGSPPRHVPQVAHVDVRGPTSCFFVTPVPECNCRDSLHEHGCVFREDSSE